jgi:toxin FitB
VSYLLDTCVISELVAKRPNSNVIAWVDNVNEPQLYLSVITVGEITRGIEKLNGGKRRRTLEDWFSGEMLPRFANRILHIDVEVMLIWGQLTAAAERQGNTLPAMDSLIASIALRYNMNLVTRNVNDFAHTGVTIINPWED